MTETYYLNRYIYTISLMGEYVLEIMFALLLLKSKRIIDHIIVAVKFCKRKICQNLVKIQIESYCILRIISP